MGEKRKRKGNRMVLGGAVGEVNVIEDSGQVVPHDYY
jgi:hypothetical protein